MDVASCVTINCVGTLRKWKKEKNIFDLVVLTHIDCITGFGDKSASLDALKSQSLKI